MTAGQQRHQDFVDGVPLTDNAPTNLLAQIGERRDELLFVAGQHPAHHRAVRSAGRVYHYTASEMLVKLKSRALMAGITMSPPPSVPASRCVGPMASMLLSMKRGDSLKRKFRTAFLILPFSMRSTPSRVSPVNSAV